MRSGIQSETNQFRFNHSINPEKMAEKGEKMFFRSKKEIVAVESRSRNAV